MLAVRALDKVTDIFRIKVAKATAQYSKDGRETGLYAPESDIATTEFEKDGTAFSIFPAVETPSELLCHGRDARRPM